MKKLKRKYRKITPEVVARLKATEALEGSATRAVEALEPDVKNPGDRGYRIKKHAEGLTGLAYVDDQLEQIGADAIDRINALVQSSDEKVAGQNARFVVDHVRGKAVQRTENKNYNLSIEAVLQ